MHLVRSTPCIQEKDLFHQKVGILIDDEGNKISFSGSDNETASGWTGHIEEFKVFKNWKDVQRGYFNDDLDKFIYFWRSKALRTIIIDLPNAIKEEFIKRAPTDIDSLDLEKWYNKKSYGLIKQQIELFEHQKDAINNWISNDMKGIFEMATGTGKTFAALGCVDEASKKNNNLLVIISTPFKHLVTQWEREVIKFGIGFERVFADSSHTNWKNVLTDLLTDYYLGYKEKLIILTTHRTLSSEDFKYIITKNKLTPDKKILLIVDEVHGIGAKESRNGLLDEYALRLGLSATPKRWYDLEGTRLIYDYFGGVVFEFELFDAINTLNTRTNQTFLTPYKYIPKFISFTEEELDEFIKISSSIVKRIYKSKDKNEEDSLLENLIFKRANIVKNAVNKLSELDKILTEFNDQIRWTIMYCSPQQKESILIKLKEKRIFSHQFTMEEGTKPDKKYHGLTERDDILNKFSNGMYQVLVAMKCLDEGVDIPPARSAIFMASSGNPREYIQRIGRILRRSSGKNYSTIYDIIVVPNAKKLPIELRKYEEKIFQMELNRYEEIAKIAINNTEAYNYIYEIKEKLYG